MIADRRRAANALTLMFVGLLVSTVGIRAYDVDLLADVAGIVLLATGLLLLSRQSADPRASRWLRAAAGLTVVLLPLIVVERKASADAWAIGAGALAAGSIVVTCVGMERLCETAAPPLAATWRQLRRLILVLAVATVLLMPLLLLGPFALLPALGLAALSAAMVVWLLVAIWRTRATIT